MLITVLNVLKETNPDKKNSRFYSFLCVHPQGFCLLSSCLICTLYVHFFDLFLTYILRTSDFRTILQESFLPDPKF
ncbi:unnamed protein product [Caenorhabditis nigoni]